MDLGRRPAIRLCGRMEVTPLGRDVARQLPGRQGRLMLAYLACKRARPVTRDELIDLLWPSEPPALPEEVLGSLLSKMRRALGPGVIVGRHDLTLVLPGGARVDVEIGAEALERGDAALAGGDARLAFRQAQSACQLIEGGFLPGFDNPWVEERRREVEELRLRALACIAEAGLALGGAELGSGERAARELISAAPLREQGYRLLMEILAERGDVAAALQAYDSLRVQLRDELGIVPGPALRAVHEHLLAGGDLVQTLAEPPPEPSPAPHREERKLVTVLAAELEVTEASDDPEELKVASARLQERVRHEVERFGGTVRDTADGAALALFGAMLVHEDDAERAVRAALRLRELGVATRAGVATGEVLVALQDQAEGTATGRAIERAIHMQRAAPAGAVLADAVTVRTTAPDAVVYDSLDEDVCAVQAVSERLTAALEHPVRTRFLGRLNELALLESLQRGVLETARPSMVVLIGHAGVGKSRLVDEFLERIADRVPAAYRGRCLAYGEGITYWALREVLWAAAGIRFDDPATTAVKKLSDRVSSVLAEPDANRVTGALAITSGIVLPDNPLERLPPGSVADEVALAWPAFLSGLATTSPVIIVIEDLHWAEEPLLEMVERLVARSKGSLLLVVTARPELAERRASWGARAGVSQVALEPLSEAVSRQLVSDLLPNASGEVRERVLATAEGNPFFAEELAQHVSDERGDPAEIPNTVRGVVAARVDGLPEAEKQTLQDAAVIGRVFWAPALEAIEAREALADALRTLEDRGLIVTRPTSSLPGQTELSFRHGLTREVAYSSIPRARRSRTHAAVGQWIEGLAGDRRDEFIELLAHHYEAASSPADAALAWPGGSTEREQLREKAVAALIEAGEAARKRLSTEQALRFAERVQALGVTDQERLAALELEARSHHAAVRSDAALAAYTAGIDVARRIGDHEALSRLRAYAILLCVRYAGAFSGDSWRAKALELVEAAASEGNGGAPTFARGALLLGRSWGVHRWLQRPRQDFAAAKREAEQAIAIAETIESPELLAAALEGFTWLISEEGFCEAEEMAERLIRTSSDSADRVEAHESKVTAACCLAWAGRFDRAAAVAAETTSEAAMLSRHRALHSAMAETFCLAPSGRFAELGDATTRVLELAAEDASNTRTCMAAVVAIAGRILWLHEALQAQAAEHAVDLMNGVSPPGRGSIYEYFVAELVRPVIGIQATATLLDCGPPPRQDAASTILYLRALLPVLAFSGASNELAVAVQEARQVARSACAPALGWIADWAAAVYTANNNPARSLEGALAATTALHQYGESYTAARLLGEFLPLVKETTTRALAEKTAQQLTLIGASASAASTRALLARI